MQSRALVLLLLIPSAVAQQSNVQVSPTGSVDFDIQHTSARPLGGLPANAFVSASDLAVPNLRAQGIREKRRTWFVTRNCRKAIKKLNKAIHLYPQYAVAYNNLAVIYGQLGDRVHENEAFEKSDQHQSQLRARLRQPGQNGDEGEQLSRLPNRFSQKRPNSIPPT